MNAQTRVAALALLAAGTLVSTAAEAISFSIPVKEDEEIKAVLNNTFTLGAAWRMSERADALVSKSAANPGLCGIPNQSCQADFRDQLYPSRTLSTGVGQYTLNADNGNLNYDKHDLIQAPIKLTQDLTLSYGDFGFFARTLAFYDFANANFNEFHPNRITADNYGTVGYATNDPGFVLPYPANRVNRVYGPGTGVKTRRKGDEIRRESQYNLQFLDTVAYGKFAIPGTEDKMLTLKLGRQTVNWGESTLLVINSINQAQPVNANNFSRVGFAVEEVFTPINQVFASFEPFENATLEGFYQLEWEPVEAPTPGTFFSTIDVGVRNAGQYVYASFGGAAEDPDGVATLQYNPLARISNTTLRIARLPDNEPQSSGQYGISLKYFAEALNNGTELGFYHMNYHSRLPYASFFATDASCARREGNSMGIDANSSATFAQTCPDVPQLHMGPVETATSSAAALDTAKFQLEYPENIKLYGFSFNTTLGDYSFQGEVAYRPNLPLQVDQEDLAFAAFGPTLTRCHNASLHCAGALPTETPIVSLPVGVPISGLDTNSAYAGTTYADSSYKAGANDYINLAVGHVPGSARSFPNFIIPYRGGVVGENAPTDRTKPYDHNNPGYIRGYERMQVYQFNIGATRVLGATDNPFGADQILLLAETGATWVPDLPSLDQLQIEAPGTFTAASAGADGSGADGSRQACSTNPTCAVGPDGLRFNPHQQDLGGYVDKFSWGYRLIGIFKYESVLPGISLQPMTVFAHDVRGTAPGPGENFIQGRKTVVFNVETRYKSSFSFTAGYTWFTGGGDYNLLRDRDYAQVFAKYLF